MNPFPKRETGFTIIEILVALSILGIGMLALARLHFASFGNNVTGNELTQATLLVQDKMEELKSLPLSDARLTPNSYTDANNPVNIQGQAGGIYTRSWTVASWGTSISARQITIRVQWMRRNKVRSVQMTSITMGGGI